MKCFVYCLQVSIPVTVTSSDFFDQQLGLIEHNLNYGDNYLIEDK